jgi:hypothetical protein
MFADDGHRSTQAYLRARTNQPAPVALVDLRRARLCRDFCQVGEALLAGRTYNIRSDGTIVLFIGERPPSFTHTDTTQRTKHALAHLETLRQRLQATLAA